MAGLSGMQPALIQLADTVASGSGLRIGQTVRVRIGGTPENLSVQVGGVRIPLGALPQLQPGQTVLLELLSRIEGFQVRITPEATAAPLPESAPADVFQGTPQALQATVQGQPGEPGLPPGNEAPLVTSEAAASTAAPAPPSPTVSAASTASTASSGLEQAISAALRTLGILSEEGAATRIVPGHLPLTEGAVTRLLALFVGRNMVGDDLAVIQRAVLSAAEEGILPPEQSEAAAGTTQQLLLPRGAGLLEAIHQLVRRASGSAEARIAAALEQGDLSGLVETVREDARAMLVELRNNSAFERFLEARGESRLVQSALDQAIGRLTGSQIQNLRGLDQPYHFVDLPFPPDAPIQHVQMHVFGRSGGTRRRFDAKNATVVLDLSTTRLGSIWVHLAITGGCCSCTFRATNDEALQAIEAGAPELKEALGNVGYANAQVHTALWTGDRLRETANLMNLFDGMDSSA